MLSLDVDLGEGVNSMYKKDQKYLKWPENDPSWFSLLSYPSPS